MTDMTNKQIFDAIEEVRTILKAKGVKTHRDRLIENAHESLERAEQAATPEEEVGGLEDAIFWYQRALAY